MNLKNQIGNAVRSLKTRIDKLEQGDTFGESGVTTSDQELTPIVAVKERMNGDDLVSVSTTVP